MKEINLLELPIVREFQIRREILLLKKLIKEAEAFEQDLYQLKIENAIKENAGIVYNYQNKLSEIDLIEKAKRLNAKKELSLEVLNEMESKLEDLMEVKETIMQIVQSVNKELNPSNPRSLLLPYIESLFAELTDISKESSALKEKLQEEIEELTKNLEGLQGKELDSLQKEIGKLQEELDNLIELDSLQKEEASNNFEKVRGPNNLQEELNKFKEGKLNNLEEELKKVEKGLENSREEELRLLKSHLEYRKRIDDLRKELDDSIKEIQQKINLQGRTNLQGQIKPKEETTKGRTKVHSLGSEALRVVIAQNDIDLKVKKLSEKSKTLDKYIEKSRRLRSLP